MRNDDSVEQVIVDLTRGIGRSEHERTWRPEDSLKEDLHIDSLEMLELVMLAEEMGGRSVPPEQAAAFDTIGDVAHWVETARAQQGERR